MKYVRWASKWWFWDLFWAATNIVLYFITGLDVSLFVAGLSIGVFPLHLSENK